MTETHLTLAPEGTAAIVQNLSGDGSGELLRSLRRHPLATDQRKHQPKRTDDAYMVRFDGTDFVQWYARHSDGWRRPFGKIMQIVGGQS